MSRSAIEDALFSWVRGTSGYAAADVLWTDYEQPRPSGAYLALRLSNMRSIGQDWYEVADSDDPTPAVGEEIVTTVWGKRAATLTLQAIAGDATGAASSSEVLETVRTRSRLPSVRTALNLAGVGIATFGPVQTVSGTLSASAFEPRAIMAVELNLTATAAEFSTFIETVGITNEITGDEYDVEA